MKKLILLLMFIPLVFTACKKENEVDKFVGTYALTCNGSVSIYFTGEEVTIPLDASGAYIYITPRQGSNTVDVSGHYNSLGFVSGDVLRMDPESVSDFSDGIYITMTFDHQPATLAGTMMSWQTNVTMKATDSFGNTFTGTGMVQNVATKRY